LNWLLIIVFCFISVPLSSFGANSLEGKYSQKVIDALRGNGAEKKVVQSGLESKIIGEPETITAMSYSKDYGWKTMDKDDLKKIDVEVMFSINHYINSKSQQRRVYLDDMKYPLTKFSCTNGFSLKNGEISLTCDGLGMGQLTFNASSMSFVASASNGFFRKGEFVGLPFPFIMAGSCYE
jgi:hypothetical protein